ncbi:MAG: response regulator [Clostridiales bacterium]|nr:response regulator [Clostridiales bacterium]
MKLIAVIRENIKEIAFVFLSLLLMVIISSVFAVRMMERELAANINDKLSTMQSNIDSDFRGYNVALINLESVVRYIIETGSSGPAGNPPEARAPDRVHLEEIERLLPMLTSSVEHYKAGLPSLISMGVYIDGKVYINADWTPPESIDFENRPWYMAAVAAQGGIAVSGPYLDAYSGQYIMSFSKEIYSRPEAAAPSALGEKLGTALIDMDFGRLAQSVQADNLGEGEYGILVDERGNFIIHPDSAMLGKPVESAGSSVPDYAHIAAEIRAGRSFILAKGITQVPAATNGAGAFGGTRGTLIAAFRRMDNGWYIGIEMPMDAYYHDVYYMIPLLVVVGLLVTVLLSALFIRLNLEKFRFRDENLSKSSFLARMSHEIRTPMNAILGISEIVLRKDIPREIHEYVSIIRQAANTLLSIINDILDFSKIEAGQLKIASKEYYFSSLVNDVVNIIRVRLLDRPISLFVKMDSQIPEILIGDEVHVRQILINLLSNAVKYTARGHIILTIEHERLDGGEDRNIRRDRSARRMRLIFSVLDTGIGMKQEDAEKIFHDFTRIDTQTQIEGTGLGLSITKSLCQAMEGDIQVTSEYGHGSTFTATIIQLIGSNKKLAAVENPSKKRVIVFEDRPVHLGSLMYTMTNLGIKPTYVKDLGEFLIELKNNEFEYAFVPSERIKECIVALESSSYKCTLVNMVELDGVSPEGTSGAVSSITAPLFCLNVAEIFNGGQTAGLQEDNERHTDYWHNVKVLIVDDMPTNLLVAKELMGMYGLDIETCGSGRAAVELCRLNRYDIVFMDHIMPEMDGVEAMKAIRSIDGGDPYYQKLPIIALTANAVLEQREMFLEKGMSDFLSKPIEVQKLRAVLKKWLPRAKRRIGEAAPVPAEGLLPPDGPVQLEIPGMSVEAGLRNLGGVSSLNAYLDILSNFCFDADEKVTQLTEYAQNADLEMYRTMVHALKGAARGIGAQEFSDFAQKMEECAKNGDLAAIERDTPPLLADLRKLIANIREALAITSGDASKEDLSALKLETLKTALKDMDIETVNDIVVNSASLPLSAKTKERVMEIGRLILMFKYDDAIEQIDALINADETRER